jgi:hypothetical protein
MFDVRLCTSASARVPTNMPLAPKRAFAGG